MKINTLIIKKILYFKTNKALFHKNLLSGWRQVTTFDFRLTFDIKIHSRNQFLWNKVCEWSKYIRTHFNKNQNKVGREAELLVTAVHFWITFCIWTGAHGQVTCHGDTSILIFVDWLAEMDSILQFLMQNVLKKNGNIYYFYIL